MDYSKLCLISINHILFDPYRSLLFLLGSCFHLWQLNWNRYISIIGVSNLDIVPDLILFSRQKKSLGNVIYITGLVLSVLGGMAIFKPYLKKEK